MSGLVHTAGEDTACVLGSKTRMIISVIYALIIYIAIYIYIYKYMHTYIVHLYICLGYYIGAPGPTHIPLRELSAIASLFPMARTNLSFKRAATEAH